MKLFLTWSSLAVASVALAACNANPNSPFRKPLSDSAGAPASPVGVAPAPAVSPVPAPAPGAPPYVLSASNAGPFINFKVYNMGTTDLEIKKEDFAILSKDSRAVTPYDKASTIIDLPQPAVVKPNETISGRAIFKTITSPLGHRLVYKPDATGTYADISPAS